MKDLIERATATLNFSLDSTELWSTWQQLDQARTLVHNHRRYLYHQLPEDQRPRGTLRTPDGWRPAPGLLELGVDGLERLQNEVGNLGARVHQRWVEAQRVHDVRQAVARQLSVLTYQPKQLSEEEVFKFR